MKKCSDIIAKFTDKISYQAIIGRYAKFYLIIKKRQPTSGCLFLPGNVLLSQGLASQLPSAQRSLTSVFGMGTGVTFLP
jgi:hypothetical protein